jgi:hypothetical protein
MNIEIESKNKKKLRLCDVGRKLIIMGEVEGKM